VKAAPVVVVLIALGVVAALWMRSTGTERKRPEVRRAAFDLPQPSDEEKNAYFFDLMRSGRSIKLGDATIPEWRIFGQAGLALRGESALGYVMDPARFPIYAAAPNTMINTLQLLEQVPESRLHPLYEPFAKYWLDPANIPPTAPGAQPGEEYRKKFFTLFTHEPRPWVVPYCVDELERADHPHDMRKPAVAILLWLGEVGEVLARYESLPPDEREPNVYLKQFVLTQTRGYAGREQPSNRREGARRLEPILRDALEIDPLIGRVVAASALLRIGDESMVDRLLELHRLGVERENLDAAWTAIIYAADDSDDPRLRQVCEELVKQEPDKRNLAYVSALQVLATRWLDAPEVRDLLWDYVKSVHFEDLRPILWLSRHEGERPRIIEALRTAIRSGDNEMERQAIRFAIHPNYPVPEVMPDVLELARHRDANEGRARFIAALVKMRFRPVLPLILADLTSDVPRTRATAAAHLLDFDDEEGVDAVAQRLRDGDEAMLGPIQGRAAAAGELGVNARLLPALFRTLERSPSELTRMRVLYIMRCRATLEGVQESLMDAYRREPSRRAATAIRGMLIELAHR